MLVIYFSGAVIYPNKESNVMYDSKFCIIKMLRPCSAQLHNYANHGLQNVVHRSLWLHKLHLLSQSRV